MDGACERPVSAPDHGAESQLHSGLSFDWVVLTYEYFLFYTITVRSALPDRSVGLKTKLLTFTKASLGGQCLGRVAAVPFFSHFQMMHNKMLLY